LGAALAPSAESALILFPRSKKLSFSSGQKLSGNLSVPRRILTAIRDKFLKMQEIPAIDG
jgi:hypothetical protein